MLGVADNSCHSLALSAGDLAMVIAVEDRHQVPDCAKLSLVCPQSCRHPTRHVTFVLSSAPVACTAAKVRPVVEQSPMPGRFGPNADMAGRVVHSLNGRVGVARPQMPSSAERPQGKAPSKQRVLDCSRQTIRKLLGFGTDSTYVWVRRHRGHTQPARRVCRSGSAVRIRTFADIGISP